MTSLWKKYYSQRPPKIESLANFEPVGRCKIPLNQLSQRGIRRDMKC